MALGKEYFSNDAYFIAGGRTLAAIKEYEQDKENAKKLQQQLAQDYGAASFHGIGSNGYFTFDTPTSHPAFMIDKSMTNGQKHYYTINHETAEGQALQAKLDRIPDADITHTVFALRLTGTKIVRTNPDDLRQDFGYTNNHYGLGQSATAASFRKYGDVYVVSVPRVVRGIFNEESKAASLSDRYNQAAGYTYEWWTPADSTPIPYSAVVALQEQARGDQLTPRSVMKAIAAFPDRR
jgi:hypothetical protein